MINHNKNQHKNKTNKKGNNSQDPNAFVPSSAHQTNDPLSSLISWKGEKKERIWQRNLHSEAGLPCQKSLCYIFLQAENTVEISHQKDAQSRSLVATGNRNKKKNHLDPFETPINLRGKKTSQRKLTIQQR